MGLTESPGTAPLRSGQTMSARPSCPAFEPQLHARTAEAGALVTVRGIGENDWLYAVGDINHRALLTHMGKYQGRACAKAILARTRRTNSNSDDKAEGWSLLAAKADHNMVPRVVFTDPQVASVGLTEQAAKDLGLKIRMVASEMGSVMGAQLHTDGYVGQLRLIIDEDTQVIVGATFVGPQVSELLHSTTVAVVGQGSVTFSWVACKKSPC